MKQKTLNTIIFLMLTNTLLTGCDIEPPKPQAVVISLHTIAEEMGINEEIKIRTETMNQQFSEEMKALSIELRKEIEDEKASHGNSPSEEGVQKIQTLQRQLRKQLSETRKKGNARISKETREVRQSHHDDVMSVAQTIALERGASIILKTIGVFWSDGSIDITDEVIGRMQGGKDTQPVDRE